MMSVVAVVEVEVELDLQLLLLLDPGLPSIGEGGYSLSLLPIVRGVHYTVVYVNGDYSSSSRSVGAIILQLG